MGWRLLNHFVDSTAKSIASPKSPTSFIECTMTGQAEVGLFAVDSFVNLNKNLTGLVVRTFHILEN